MIRVRVSSEEKAELEQRAGSKGVSAYVRELALSVPGSAAEIKAAAVLDADGDGQDRAAPAVSHGGMPAQSWGSRVRQLCMQGVPRMAAEKMADQEFRGVR